MNNNKIVGIVSFGTERHIIDFTGNSSLDDLLIQVNTRWPELVPAATLLKFITPDSDGDLIILKRDVDVKNMHYLHQALSIPNAKLEASLIRHTVQEVQIREPPIPRERIDTATGPWASNDQTDSNSCNELTHENITEVSNTVDLQNNGLDSWQQLLQGVGQKFENASHFREVLRRFGISHGRDYFFIKNEPERITVVCNNRCKEEVVCKWRVHASKSLKDGIFAIRKANLTHTCEVIMCGNRHKKANGAWVAGIVKEKLRDSPLLAPSQIVRDVLRDYKVCIPYRIAWKGKEVAMQDIHGKDAMCYNSLRWYCDAIKNSNPGSVAEFELTEENRFHRLFVAFDACLQGFCRGCRPVLFIDGTFLKNKYKGVLCGATSLDANNQMFVVAIAVVDGETDDNWRWFFMMLRSCLPRDRAYVIMSDRQQGILKARQICFPDSYHLYCLRHLEENFKTEVLKFFPNEDKPSWIKKFDQAAKTVDRAVFLEKWSLIVGSLRTAKTKEFFDKAAPDHWANAVYRGPRWGQLYNNIAESFNSWIVTARHLPVPSMVDEIRVKIMTLMNERKELSERLETTLCENPEKMLIENINEGRGLEVRSSTNLLYEIRVGSAVYAVNLETSHRSCSCEVWRLEGIPCPHACAAIHRARLSTYQFCDPCFTSAAYKEAYNESIKPVPTSNRPETSHEDIIRPPVTRPMPGRKKKKRYRSKAYSYSITCGRCGGKGHNKRACKRPIADG